MQIENGWRGESLGGWGVLWQGRLRGRGGVSGTSLPSQVSI